MFFFMAHDDPHELKDARFAAVCNRAQIQPTDPATKTNRALIQIIEVRMIGALLVAS